MAVTRGFGDANLKGWVSAEPEVRQLMVSEECEFLILATDGLWDKVLTNFFFSYKKNVYENDTLCNVIGLNC